MNLKKIYGAAVTSLFLFSSLSYAKILIITHAYNRPDFIEWQVRSFEKFLLDDYEFVIFNDAPNKELRDQINAACLSLGVEVVAIPHNLHAFRDPSHRHVEVITYSLKTRGYLHDDIVVLFDSDMFLIKPVSIKSLMEHYDIAAVQQSRGDFVYMWPNLVFMNLATLPDKKSIDWSCGSISGVGVDTGGFTYYYLKNNPDLKICWIDVTYVNESDEAGINFMKQNPPRVEFLLDKHIFHYGAASWDNSIDHAHKTVLFRNYMIEVLA